MIKRSFLIVSVLILLITLFGRTAGTFPTAMAQSSLDPWTTPVNVSMSGSTSQPSLVLDANGFLHVFWYDKADEAFLYTRREGNEWTEPARLNVPFEEEDPRFLLSDPQGIIHAFWTNEDDELLYAYISVDSLRNNPSWSRFQLLSSGVVDFDAKIDSAGRTHLAYLRVEETSNFPAGIYHRFAEAPGGAWSSPTLLNSSRYFRSVDDELANVNVAVTQVDGKDNVFVAWDNRPLRQVYLIKSTDGGSQWQEAQVIDGPSEISPLEDPFNLLVHAYGNNVLLLWGAGLQSGFDCTEYSQFSSDLGETWFERQVMYKNMAGCPQENVMVNLDDGLVLMSTIQDQPYLIAWNGREWSEPQIQSVLSSFTNTERFETIVYRCHQTAYHGNQLFVAGCDVEGDGDIWVTSRALGSLSDWYGQTIGWTNLETLTDEQLNITSPTIICTSENKKHVLWSQTLEEGDSFLDTAIYYAKSTEEGWTQPNLVIEKPDARLVQPEAIIDNKGNLVVVWSRSDDLGLYSSHAIIDQAENAFNWFNPVQLPSLQPIASSPDVKIDQKGNIIVVYAIPVNEDRGIYVTRSDDGGETWIQPIKVFDAVASKWPRVDQPKLAQTSDGTLHLIWTQKSVAGGAIASAVFYANSGDGGQTWSQSQLVVKEPLGSVEIVPSGDRTINILWLSLGDVAKVLHQYSINDGDSWSTPVGISGIEEVPVLMDVKADREGRLHLVQAIEEQARNFSIKYSIWNGARWLTNDSLNLGAEYSGQFNALDICVDSGDQLTTVFSLIQEDESSRNLKEGLYLTSHPLQKEALEAPTAIELIFPTQVVTSTPQAAILEASPSPEPNESQILVTLTPTGTKPAGGSEGNQPTSGTLDQPWAGMALGLGLAFITVVSALGFILYRRRQRDYRW